MLTISILFNTSSNLLTSNLKIPILLGNKYACKVWLIKITVIFFILSIFTINLLFFSARAQFVPAVPAVSEVSEVSAVSAIAAVSSVKAVPPFQQFKSFASGQI